ncbi:hypothetical protein BGX26_001875 [Mortierella sp. AD094]|nr:hypothetical protein BGX26_001875 [Mortierella sp. AD094]
MAGTQQEMHQMQKQTLNRLANIQNRVQAMLTQTYELHEYPIPRLFIILPKPARRRDMFGRLFANQFKLFFLCECGEYTKTERTTIPHEIHLAKYKGYDISKPNEFFEKYGSYILTVMHMFKYGIMADGIVVPSLEKFRIIEGQGQGQDQTKYEELEVLEGSELRQLQSYLSFRDEGRVLGNLYRIVTTKGHVKWVCNDHYRVNYRENAMNDLREIIEVNSGTFIENIGKVVTRIPSSTLARQFYAALTKARGIQELEIDLEWNVTMDDLKKFADAVTMANISHLTIGKFDWKRPATDLINRARRYDPITQLSRVQSLTLCNSSDFFKRVSSSSWTTSQQLRVLMIQQDITFDHGSSTSFFAGLFNNCPGLTNLRLRTRQLKSLAELVVDKLGDLQQVEGTQLEIAADIN